MAGYKTVYDIKKVGINIGVPADAFPVEGLQSVVAERTEDEYTHHTSADGGYRAVKNNKAVGTITLTIASWSSTNELIMALYRSGVQFRIAAVDLNSALKSSHAIGDGCLLSKVPAWNKEMEESDVEYVFTCGDLQIWHSGAGDE